jgi:prophage antirepressor-like protein
MMNELQRVFNYQEKDVRTIIQEDILWFVAKDICEILEISNNRDAVARLDEDEKGVGIIDTLGGPQETNIVNEAGLYSLILTSRKSEAKAFKRWVTHEVIPSIRKTGSYSTPSTTTEALLHAVQILAQQERQILQLETAQKESSQKLENLNYRIDSLDAINMIGDMRQRLNKMIQKYARDRGLLFNAAWNEFRRAFNTAYHTNLELLIINYEKKHNKKKVTIPQYLLASGKIEDGVRVADKMLNKAS